MGMFDAAQEHAERERQRLAAESAEKGAAERKWGERNRRWLALVEDAAADFYSEAERLHLLDTAPWEFSVIVEAFKPVVGTGQTRVMMNVDGSVLVRQWSGRSGHWAPLRGATIGPPVVFGWMLPSRTQVRRPFVEKLGSLMAARPPTGLEHPVGRRDYLRRVAMLLSARAAALGGGGAGRDPR